MHKINTHNKLQQINSYINNIHTLLSNETQLYCNKNLHRDLHHKNQIKINTNITKKAEHTIIIKNITSNPVYRKQIIISVEIER